MELEFSEYVESRDTTTPTAIDLIVIVQGGVAKVVTPSQLTTLIFGQFVDGETPSGDVDDVNTVFTLANNPIAASVKVYQNGIRLNETDDYTIDGDEITFVTPPESGPPSDIILVDYRIAL